MYTSINSKTPNIAPRMVSGNYDLATTVKQLRWETVEERPKYFAAILMYRCSNGEAPFFLASPILPA